MNLFSNPQTNWKFIAIILALGIVVGGGMAGYFQMTKKQIQEVPTNIFSLSREKIPQGWATYRNAEHGYQISYPSDFFLKENSDIIAQDVEAKGAALVFPKKYIPVENFFDANINILVGNNVCPNFPVKKIVVKNGMSFEQSEWTGSAAGNIYEGTVYTAKKENACYRITLQTHLGNAGNFYVDEEKIRDLERRDAEAKQQLLFTLNHILFTFRFIE
ncbi:MAG: hypothetical protein HYW95_01660 [Candidatus Wildermuthbacteria bacterium]|nr:hypothetical protein [Candidatus Wildermuthbacteria bacterium]